MSIGHTQMSIRPLDEQKCPLDIHMSIRPMDEQKCPFDIQMSIRPLGKQKCPVDIQMSIRPMDEQKCPVDIQMSIGHLAEVLDMYEKKMLSLPGLFLHIFGRNQPRSQGLRGETD